MPRLNGRRGAFLALFGVIYAAIGLSYVFAEADAPVRESMRFLPEHYTLTVVGVAWVVAAVVAVVAAFLPSPRDRFGFMALSAAATGWSFLNFMSFVTGHAERGWVSAVIFGAFGTASLIVAGMANSTSAAIVAIGGEPSRARARRLLK